MVIEFDKKHRTAQLMDEMLLIPSLKSAIDKNELSIMGDGEKLTIIVRDELADSLKGEIQSAVSSHKVKVVEPAADVNLLWKKVKEAKNPADKIDAFIAYEEGKHPERKVK